MLVDSDTANTVGNDMSTGRVFNVLDMSVNVGLNGGILEDAVACLVECAILKHETVDVA
jgi:hypothetical protein